MAAAEVGNGHPTLLGYFPQSTLLWRFSVLQMTTRKRPRTRSVGALSLVHQHFAISHDDNADTDAGAIIHNQKVSLFLVNCDWIWTWCLPGTT